MTRAKPIVKPYVIALYLGSVLLFVLVKGAVRPFVLAGDFWIGFDIFVLSFPNFVEAIVGMSNGYGLLLYARHRDFFGMGARTELGLLMATATLTGLYVLTQEFGLHNLGGNNVTDPFDVAASIIGIGVMIAVFSKYGFFKQPADQT
jgi:hypothetical protein